MFRWRNYEVESEHRPVSTMVKIPFHTFSSIKDKINSIGESIAALDSKEDS